MEEVDLRGIESCGSGGDDVVDGGDDTNSSFGGKFVGFDFLLELEDGGVGEDESDFIFEDGDESLDALDASTILFLEVLELVLFDSFGAHADDLLGEGVLVDDEMGVVASEELADLLHLVGADVGEVGEDDLLVGSKHLVQSFDCSSLLCSIITHSKILNIMQS